MKMTPDNAIGIIRNTERWLKKYEPAICLDCQDIIRSIVDGIKYHDRDPKLCVDEFEDWIEDMLRMG